MKRISLIVFLVALVCVSTSDHAIAEGHADNAGNPGKKPVKNSRSHATEAHTTKGGCISGMVEFAQITVTRLDAGEQTFDAFRILSSGLVEWARWSSSGHLITCSDRRDMGSKIFRRVMSSPSLLNPPVPHPDGALGRQAYKVDMTVASGGGIKTVSMDKMPEEMADLIDQIKRATKVAPVSKGWYMWTRPALPGRVKDLDLTKGACDSAAAKILSKALTTGRLIVPAESYADTYVSGENANRIEFAARVPGGDIRFGFVQSRMAK